MTVIININSEIKQIIYLLMNVSFLIVEKISQIKARIESIY